MEMENKSEDGIKVWKIREFGNVSTYIRFVLWDESKQWK